MDSSPLKTKRRSHLMVDNVLCECHVLEELWYACRYAEEQGHIIPDDDVARIHDILNRVTILKENAEYLKFKCNQCDTMLKLDKKLSAKDKETAIELIVNNENSIKYGILDNTNFENFENLFFESPSSKVWCVAKAIYMTLPSSYKPTQEKFIAEFREKHPNLEQNDLYPLMDKLTYFSTKLHDIAWEALTNIFHEWKASIHRLRIRIGKPEE